MKTKFSILMMGLGLVLIMSCTKYPQTDERLLEDLAVVTQYDTKVDFNNYKYYSLPSAIIEITDKDTTLVSNSNTAAILGQIETDMNERGFVKAVPPQMPDLGVNVLYFENTYIYTYYYDWWGYYPYYYYYYPYYPVYYSSYTTGMLNIELSDLKYPNQDNNVLYLRWNAFIRGLMTGNHTNSQVTNSVHQAFVQTPQLMTTAK